MREQTAGQPPDRARRQSLGPVNGLIVDNFRLSTRFLMLGLRTASQVGIVVHLREVPDANDYGFKTHCAYCYIDGPRRIRARANGIEAARPRVPAARSKLTA